MRLALVLLLVLLAVPLASKAQEPAKPILRMEFKQTETIPGQPLVLRVTVLVPTWLPEAPVFPSLEVPNVMVRLPERASGPASERVKGETWSGVTRAYRLYPMKAGGFRIPPLPVTVTYADPEAGEPLTAKLLTDEIAFRGTAPEGAEDLDPFIAAEALELKQTIQGEPGKLEPGGAFTRTVTVRVKGTSPIFIPPLIPPFSVPGIAAYPKEPVVTEIMERGVLSGARVETVTYVAEAGGQHSEPPIRLRWFDLGKEQVATAEAEGLEIVSEGPPPSTRGASFDWRAAAPWIIAAVLLVVLAGLLAVRLWPRVAAWRRRRHDVYRASEAFAFAQAIKALQAHDFGSAIGAIDRWSSRLPAAPTPNPSLLSDALTALGAALYGQDSRSPSDGQWSDAVRALRATRRQRLGQSAAASAGLSLPPLNPQKAL